MNHSSKFEVGEELESANELDMSTTIEVKHHDFDEWESCEDELESTNLELDDDILSVEYELFSYGFD